MMNPQKTEVSNKLTAEQKKQLLSLIWQHENAVRDYKFAQGAHAGKSGRVSFLKNIDTVLFDYASDADDAEAALTDFIDTL